ncbi:ribonuclease H-like domain-containing protein [Tanacetum coccineum]
MVTRAQVGTAKPNPCFNFHMSHICPLPKSLFIALSDPNWRAAMYDEYNALVKNSTWLLVLKPPNVNVVLSMWLFRNKYHADGSLSMYKARLVANGRSQQFGIDCDDTFSHVLDVKNAFLNGDLSETVYMYQPPGYANREFDMTNLWALNYLLGISVTRDSTCMFLSQKKYALEILDRAHMAKCNPTRTPVDTESKLGSDGDPISNPTLYRSLVGSLVAYTDADWAGCPTTRRSTSGYCVFLGDNLLSWSAKRQHTLSRSSLEAEYRGIANVVAETAWLRNLIKELHTLLLYVTLVYCDNVSAIYMTANLVQHQRTKHIEIDVHFVRDMVARGHVRVLHVPSHYHYADIFTKGIPCAPFEKFRISLSVRSSLAQTVRAY